MNHIKAHVTRSGASNNRVGVCAVVVQLHAVFVGSGGNLENPGFKNSQGVWVGQHDRGNVCAKRGFERVKIHFTAFIARNFDDFKTCHRCGGRIGAVRRIWANHHTPLLEFATLFKVFANH